MGRRDRLLADASLPPDVPLARMVDPAMNEAMAETALWAVLGLHRGFFDYARRQRERTWRVHAQRRADEVVVAVLGLGEMGAAVARRLSRNGYSVLGWSRSQKSIDGVALPQRWRRAATTCSRTARSSSTCCR